jgi:hypothetical protein
LLYDTNDICKDLGISRNTFRGDGSKKRPGWIKLGYWPEPDFPLGPHENSKWVWLPETFERAYAALPANFKKAANDNSPPETES